MKLRAMLHAARVAAIVYLGGVPDISIHYHPAPGDAEQLRDLMGAHNFPCVVLPLTADATTEITERAPAAKFGKALSYQGLLSRVARQSGVSRSHVYYIATGKRRSARVEAALLQEIHRVEAGAASRSLKGATQ
jgi:hypothetical protein